MVRTPPVLEVPVVPVALVAAVVVAAGADVLWLAELLPPPHPAQVAAVSREKELPVDRPFESLPCLGVADHFDQFLGASDPA